MEGTLQFFVIGFLAWFVTGLDDLLAVLALVKTNGTRTTIAVITGVMLAAVTAFLLSAIIVFQLVGPDKIGEYRHWSGLILIVVGFLSLRSIWWGEGADKTLEKPDSPLKAFGVSYVAYLANTFDDMSSDCVWLVQTRLDWTKVTGLFAGNITAVVIAVAVGLAMLTVFTAYPKVKKAIYTVGSIIIISMGLAIISRLF